MTVHCASNCQNFQCFRFIWQRLETADLVRTDFSAKCAEFQAPVIEIDDVRDDGSMPKMMPVRALLHTV